MNDISKSISLGMIEHKQAKLYFPSDPTAWIGAENRKSVYKRLENKINIYDHKPRWEARWTNG